MQIDNNLKCSNGTFGRLLFLNDSNEGMIKNESCKCGKPQRNLTINVIVARFYDPPASKLYLFGSPKYATPSCKHSTVSIDFIT